MGSKTVQRGRYVPRDSLYVGHDPDVVLASLPNGTHFWKRVLGAIVRKYNSQHAKLYKVVSFKTMKDRSSFYFSFFNELRTHTPFRETDRAPSSNAILAPYVAKRLAQGRSHKTVNSGLGIVRRILNLAAKSWRDENGMTWLEHAPAITMLPLVGHDR